MMKRGKGVIAALCVATLLSSCIAAGGTYGVVAPAPPRGTVVNGNVQAANGIGVSLSAGEARQLAVNNRLTGYRPLPPGIARNLARGKPLPPGIAKQAVPGVMLAQLPRYDGYEWQIAGTDLILVAIGTLVVGEILNDVFR